MENGRFSIEYRKLGDNKNMKSKLQIQQNGLLPLYVVSNHTRYLQISTICNHEDDFWDVVLCSVVENVCPP